MRDQYLARKRSRFCPQSPTDRQKLFLSLKNEREVFYGGAAGGGKSSALLMAATEYVDKPNYAALLLRRTYADLSKPGALLDRAAEWFRNTGARWNDQKKQWKFPGGGKITFGYLEAEIDKYNYQSSEYQFIGFDELSQFSETQYVYMFSRLRRLANSNVPLRMRAGSNPGGVGANWVYNRFIPEDFTPADALTPKVWIKEGVDDKGRAFHRAFVPARMHDNPYLDQAEYVEALSELDAVTREQLLEGDWQIRERGNVYPMWEDGANGKHVITWEQFANVFGVNHIPRHWLGATGHDPGFDPDPRAAVWNFVAGANGPLTGDVFCMRELYENRMTVDDFAEAVKLAEAPLFEAARIKTRIIGHEASSEQATLSQKHALRYTKGKPDANGGIAQMRHALRITDTDKPHPFKPHKTSCDDVKCQGCILGRPHFYVIVDKNQLLVPRDERGMVNFRAEIASYRYVDGSPSQQRGMPKIVPYDFFNHLMDAQRGVAQNWFARIAPLSDEERIESKLNPALRKDAVAEGIADGTRNRQGAVHARMAEIARIQQAERQEQYSHPLANEEYGF